MLVAGAVPLLLAGRCGWNVRDAVVAALMSVGVVAVLAAPREAERTTRRVHGPHFPAAFVNAWRDLLRALGSAAALRLARWSFYRLSELVRNIMNPFYLDLGLTSRKSPKWGRSLSHRHGDPGRVGARSIAVARLESSARSRPGPSLGRSAYSFGLPRKVIIWRRSSSPRR